MMRLIARSTINLLPWREVERARRARVAIGVLSGAAFTGILTVMGGGLLLEQSIEVQEHRNRFIEREISALERRVDAAEAWRAERHALRQRVEFMAQLRDSRRETVRVFDALVETLVEGVHYSRIERRGQWLDTRGFAESPRLVSALMRKLDGSPVFASAEFKRLRDVAPEAGSGSLAGAQGSTFEMKFLQVPPPSQRSHATAP